MTYYLKFLSFKAVKIAVLLITAGLIVFGGIGLSRMEKGLGVTDVVTTGSYVDHFLTKRTDYFANVGILNILHF